MLRSEIELQGRILRVALKARAAGVDLQVDILKGDAGRQQVAATRQVQVELIEGYLKRLLAKPRHAIDRFREPHTTHINQATVHSECAASPHEDGIVDTGNRHEKARDAEMTGGATARGVGAGLEYRIERGDFDI